MKTTLICVTTKNSKRSDDYLKAWALTRGPLLDAFDAPCTPVGFAAEQIPADEFDFEEGIPADFCSALDVINVLPDGSLQMCCGAPFHINSLKAGNLRIQSLKDLVAAAEWDPIYNSLSANIGPVEIAKLIRRERPDIKLRDTYVTACEACHDIFRHPGIREWLTGRMDVDRPELFINRALASEFRETKRREEVLNLS